MSKLIIKNANPLHVASVNIAKTLTAEVITAIDKERNIITVANPSVASYIDEGRSVRITGGTPNDGTYLIKSVTVDGGNTLIELYGYGNITDDTVAGSVVYYGDVSKDSKLIAVEGDVAAAIIAATAIEVVGASNNVGYYTIVTATYDAPSNRTIIEVNEEISSSEVDGEVVYLVNAATVPTDSVMFKGVPSKTFVMDFKGGWSVTVKNGTPPVATEEIVISKGNHMFVTTWEELIISPAPISTLDAVDKINALIN